MIFQVMWSLIMDRTIKWVLRILSWKFPACAVPPSLWLQGIGPLYAGSCPKAMASPPWIWRHPPWQLMVFTFVLNPLRLSDTRFPWNWGLVDRYLNTGNSCWWGRHWSETGGGCLAKDRTCLRESLSGAFCLRLLLWFLPAKSTSIGPVNICPTRD